MALVKATPQLLVETGPGGGLGYEWEGRRIRVSDGNNLAAELEAIGVVSAVVQGIGADLPDRPVSNVVHWYSTDKLLPTMEHPYDQVFPSGPLALYWEGQQGACLDAGNAAATSNASGSGVIAGAFTSLLDKSQRANHVTAAGAARPTLDARVNLVVDSVAMTTWDRTNGGVGVLPVITPNAGFDPEGNLTATQFDLNCVDASNSANRSFSRSAHTSPSGTKYRARIWLKAATPSDVGKIIRLLNENTNSHGNLLHTLTSEWVYVERDPVRSGAGTITNWLIECRGTYTQAAASVLVWHPDLRYLGDDAEVPAYQPIRSATDYDTAGFPIGAYFDGVDDGMSAAAGGGGTTGFFWSGSIRLDKLGVAQTLFSDASTNAGYIVRITSSNQLQLSAGNGSSYVSATTSAVLSLGDKAVLTAWHDGVNLYVEINNDTPSSAAFVLATAGTAGFTVGKDNGAASGYFQGKLFSSVYLKNKYLSSADRSVIRIYCSGKAKMGVTE